MLLHRASATASACACASRALRGCLHPGECDVSVSATEAVLPIASIRRSQCCQNANGGDAWSPSVRRVFADNVENRKSGSSMKESDVEGWAGLGLAGLGWSVAAGRGQEAARRLAGTDRARPMGGRTKLGGAR